MNKSGLKQVICWETEYYHEMKNHQEILAWMEGAGLRPIFSNMDSLSRDKFSKAYLDALSQAYPLQANSMVLLPYRRIFMLGLR